MTASSIILGEQSFYTDYLSLLSTRLTLWLSFIFIRRAFPSTVFCRSLDILAGLSAFIFCMRRSVPPRIRQSLPISLFNSRKWLLFFSCMYRVFIKYCVFFQEFSKVCNLYLASTRLLLVVQKKYQPKVVTVLSPFVESFKGEEGVAVNCEKHTIFPEHLVVKVDETLSWTPLYVLTQYFLHLLLAIFTLCT